MAINQDQLRDDFLHGIENPTELISDRDEFNEALKAFEDAQKLKRLADNLDFQFFLRKLADNAQYHAQRLLADNGLNKEKHDKLLQNHISARATVQFIQELIQGAKDTPQPIFSK